MRWPTGAWVGTCTSKAALRARLLCEEGTSERKRRAGGAGRPPRQGFRLPTPPRASVYPSPGSRATVRQRRIVGAKVIEKGFFSDSEKPEIMLNDKQVRDALVEVSAPGAQGQVVRTKIPVSSIPVNEFSAVQARLRKEGSPYSTADVVQAWHEFTLAKKGKK